MKKILVLTFFISFVITISFSQQLADTITPDIFDLTFEELMDLEVQVVSKQDVSIKDAPAIVTVITENEILNSGARDLIDVLNLVPGFAFNIDVQSVKGITFRGNWANEGKVLLMIDGQEINEDQYSTLQFGNHFSVEQIKKIEIIRGPGSAIYGGYAELSVINIITKSGADINGVKVATNYGQLQKNYGHRNASFCIGKEIDDFSFSMKTFYSQANSSDEIYTDFWDETYDLTTNNAAKQDVINTNLGLTYKNLSAKVIYDNYMTNSVDMFDELVTPPQQVDFQSFLSEVKYNVEIKDKLKIIPKFNFKSQKSWLSFDDFIYTDRITNKFTGDLLISYDFNKHLNVLVGTDLSYLTATIIDTTLENPYSFGNGKTLNFNNHAVFGQFLIKSKIANISLGGRYDNHEQFKGAFSPRIGIVKSFSRLYLKLLYNGAFRAPAIENINNAPSNFIIPEQTYVGEFEVGYNINNVGFSINFFDIDIDSTIVYFYDEENDVEGYKNVGQTGTSGLEFNIRLKSPSWGYIIANYSYYSTFDKNYVIDFSAPDNTLVANPQHKVSLNTNFTIFKNFSINPSALYFTGRYGYTGVDENDDLILSKLDPVLIFNISLLYRNLFIKNLNFSVTAHDILDQEYVFYQPYNGYHAPFPGKGREISAKLSYLMNF